MSLRSPLLLSLCALFTLSLPSQAQDKAPSDPLSPLFATINGESFSYRKYVRLLERQNVLIANGQTTNALRLVIDQMIGNQVILSEAAKFNAVPTDDEVNRYFQIQKRLYEGQYPGRSYDATLAQQGITADDIKSDMKVQLAEGNLYTKKFGVGDKELRDLYDKAPSAVGLPTRVQMSVVLVTPDSDDMKKAQALFQAKTPFPDVARQINPLPLRASAGLVAQTIPLATLPTEYQTKIEKLVEGGVFGPVDFKIAANQPTVKAWVRIEQKLLPLIFPYEEAIPLLKRQIVAAKLADPANQKVRNEIVRLKLNASFEPTEPQIKDVWLQIKKEAETAPADASSLKIPHIP